jgi:hypothetical protein
MCAFDGRGQGDSVHHNPGSNKLSDMVNVHALDQSPDRGDLDFYSILRSKKKEITQIRQVLSTNERLRFGSNNG